MENGLNGHSLYKMPALNNEKNNSEFLCHINNPEDVGAVVTSFCKVVQDGDQMKVTEQLKKTPQDIIVSIKDEESEEESEEEIKTEPEEITYEIPEQKIQQAQLNNESIVKDEEEKLVHIEPNSGKF